MDVALVGLLFEGFAFVVDVLASAESHLHLDTPLLEVERERNQSQSLRLDAFGETADFLFVHQQTATPFCLMVELVRLCVWRNVNSDGEEFAVFVVDVAVREAHAVVAAAFDLGTHEFDARLHCLQDFIVMACLAVLGDVCIEGRCHFCERTTAAMNTILKEHIEEGDKTEYTYLVGQDKIEYNSGK